MGLMCVMGRAPVEMWGAWQCGLVENAREEAGDVLSHTALHTLMRAFTHLPAHTKTARAQKNLA